MAIAWDPSLSIGVDPIDLQHRELFHRIDRLLEASATRTTEKEVGALLEFLAEYVRFHFQTEETFMDSVRYPRAAEHRAEHEGFARELALLRAQHASEGGTALLVVRVTGRATQWLREHIYRADKELGKFAAEKRR
ncbi:MAG TPA: bacteriohemerythrin [Anaeromyxobacter sp.]